MESPARFRGAAGLASFSGGPERGGLFRQVLDVPHSEGVAAVPAEQVRGRLRAVMGDERRGGGGAELFGQVERRGVVEVVGALKGQTPAVVGFDHIGAGCAEVMIHGSGCFE